VHTHEKKYEITFQNWVLGGSLVSVKSSESDSRRARKKTVLVEIDSVSVLLSGGALILRCNVSPCRRNSFKFSMLQWYVNSICVVF